ncbi:unnamed protein product [Schistocephalus solidus]|uniref:NTF2 domain-containing protein n=1 Tax=Schistocephalus solidus TaxID=70667 RepID=A0A3P7DD96_SCHSO|nr:unnamed protein product [Schistocephalus solidus]
MGARFGCLICCCRKAFVLSSVKLRITMNGDVAMTNFTVPTMDFEAISTVADEFVMQYYTVMSKCPQQLHRFYSHDSSVIHEDAPIFGQENIFNAFKDMPLSDTRVLIHKVDALKSVQNTILIQVCGEMSIGGAPPRRFMRSFTLCEKTARNFYVLNDIFHYQDRVFIPEGHNEELEHGKYPRFLDKSSKFNHPNLLKNLEPRLLQLTAWYHQADNWQTQHPPAPKPQAPVAPEPEPAPIKKETPTVAHEEQPKEAEHPSQLLAQEPAVSTSAPSPPPNAPAPANTARMSWAERASAQKAGPPPPQPRRVIPNPGSDAQASVPAAQRSALMTRGGQPNRPLASSRQGLSRREGPQAQVVVRGADEEAVVVALLRAVNLARHPNPGASNLALLRPRPHTGRLLSKKPQILLGCNYLLVYATVSLLTTFPVFIVFAVVMLPLQLLVCHSAAFVFLEFCRLVAFK